MIDERTRNRLRLIETAALHDGQNLFELLDQAKLLATEDRLKSTQINALTLAIMQLQEQQTQALVNLGGGQNTAADAHRGCVVFLEFVLAQLEQR